MRRVLTVAALGLLWTQTAWAQGKLDAEPARSLAILSDPTGYYEMHQRESAKEEAWLANRAPALTWGRGENFEGTWFPVIAQTRSGMCWDNLFPSCLDRYEPQPYTAVCSCLDLLNYLCFFDALSPIPVGPNMGPIFHEPAAQWEFIGYLR